MFVCLLDLTGILARGGATATGFLRSKHQPEEHKYPYIQLCTIISSWASGPATDALHKASFNYRHQVYNQLDFYSKLP